MISKKVLSSFAALTILVFAISFVSALTITTPTDMTRNVNSVPITVSTDVNLTNVVFSFNPNPLTQGPATVTLSTSESGFNLNAGASKTINILADFSVDSFEIGKYASTINASGTDASNNAVSKTGTVTHLSSFCSDGEKGDLEIRNVDFQNDGEGGDEDWNLLDDITIEVEVKNVGSDDIDDVFVEIGLFDSDGDNVIDDLDFENADEEEFDIGRIKDGDKETVEFKFKVPADFEDGTYKLVVKAYDDDQGEENICDDTAGDLDNEYFQSIDIERESDEGKFIAFDKIVFKPTEATCGETVTLTTDVYNIGDEDQEQVKVNLFGSTLNVNLDKEIRTDLDQGDKETISFTFVIPQNAEDKLHTLDLTAEYDYRDSTDTYRESSDEEKTVSLRVLGCNIDGNVNAGSIASISATLDSVAKAGEPLVVRSTIKNLMSGSTSFVIDSVGHESWATLDSISQRIVPLNSGEESQIVFTFTPNKDVSGQKSFTIKVQSGSDIETRDVVVNLEPASKSGFLTGSAIGSGNTLIWTIGIINVVLIILIIVVAVSLARR
jgi:hypothetical protein